jgi:hypothetical protein
MFGKRIKADEKKGFSAMSATSSSRDVLITLPSSHPFYV